MFLTSSDVSTFPLSVSGDFFHPINFFVSDFALASIIVVTFSPVLTYSGFLVPLYVPSSVDVKFTFFLAWY